MEVNSDFEEHAADVGSKEEEERGGLITRTQSRAIAQVGLQIELHAISTQDRLVDLQETRPTKRLKLTIKRHAKPQASQTEAAGDAPIGGEGNVPTLVIFSIFSSTKL
ncbi:uncharacterized protein LOC109823638 [Asparagus officinalis]|uniref:uncharacterized protein LOC109823638 n=1 Tax=Asparagus officinalis TaxID=4686 RepID=UPI00098E429E|nr:uncharacterized protein LOC109823638 [Asparagus officinalis]